MSSSLDRTLHGSLLEFIDGLVERSRKNIGRKNIDVDVKGEILDLKITVNRMTDSLRVFAAEVTR